jgi:glycosyltransferase involved in cell wall biosynthesis
VEFAGELKGDALRSAMARMTISVLTSKNNEGLPNAVLESMALGLPVVSTAIGGVTEVIDDGVSGFLVPPEDPSAVAERVLTLLEHPSLARAIGERGQRRVEEDFGMRRMIAEFRSLYDELIAGPTK